MKQIFTLFLLAVFVCTFTTACGNRQKTKQNLIQSKRRFAEYVEPQKQSNHNTIDLSDGQKLRYDARFGPSNLNFDIKIVDPY